MKLDIEILGMYIGAQAMTPAGEGKLSSIDIYSKIVTVNNNSGAKGDNYHDIEDIKLILRPRKSLIKEELALLSSVSDWIAGASKMHQIDTPMAIRILIALRIDIFDLIKDGGAINFYDLHPGKIWPIK